MLRANLLIEPLPEIGAAGNSATISPLKKTADPFSSAVGQKISTGGPSRRRSAGDWQWQTTTQQARPCRQAGGCGQAGPQCQTRS
jgi:hypothetical protein